MQDDEKKRKYQNIISRLQIIDNKISVLSKNLISLEKTAREGIEIDGESSIKEEIDRYKKTLASTSSTIRNTIIPSLKRKTKE